MVESLRATLPRPLAHEIILIDDSSTDGTSAWLDSRRDPAYRVLRNERNLGFARTNNRAAAVARGERLVLLNNDLVLRPGWFEGLARAHASRGARAGVTGNVQLDFRTRAVDHAGIVLTLKAKPEHDRVLPSRLRRWLRPVRRVPAVTAACVMIDAALWRALGGFDENYVNGGEDVDLCMRAAALGKINAVALRSVVWHHVSSSVGRKLRDEANSERLARRWRPEFVRGAARTWCRARLEAILADPGQADPWFAWQIWCFARGWSRTPPPAAIAALDGALELEFARWASVNRERL